MQQSLNSSAIGSFVSGITRAVLPPAVTEAAKQCAVDWFSACIAGRGDPDVSPIVEVIHAQRSQGNALALDGRRGAAAPMALVNGVLAHTVDFDDFHLASVHHASAPTFAAALALGMDRGCSGADILAGFVAGFEVGTQLGLGGVGMKLAKQGWHPTSILGHLSAAAACAAILKLDAAGVERAMGFAAVQAGGLMAAAGTLSKAVVVGKAAMAGVMAAQLAERDVRVPTNLLDTGASGLFSTLFQNDFVPQLHNLGRRWQILENTYKPYPACQLAHASFDAGAALSRRLDVRAIRKVRAFVNPFALTIAKYRDPKTSLEARFSLNYCIALGLLGHRAAMADFTEVRLADEHLRVLRDLVEGVPDEGVERWGSRLEVTLDDGSVVIETVDAALGSLGRPMGWPELEAKFLTVAEPVMGKDAAALLAALRAFDQPGAMARIDALLASHRTS